MPAERLIDAAQVARFRADLERLTGEPPTPDRPLGVAVSGGGDSLALLLLAHAAYPDGVVAATVDHELRPEAADEAAYVARLCADRGIPHTTLRRDPARAVAATNLQERARTIRYACLEAWATAGGFAHIATGHQRDDIAETFLMRADRAAGVRSLAAMRPARTLAYSTVLLLRPLLRWTRGELAAIVAAARLEPVVDPSNADARFDRVRVRALLAATPELRPEGLAGTAANLRDVEEALEWVVLGELTARFEDDEAGGVWLDPGNLPFEIRRRLVGRAVEQVRQDTGLFDEWRDGAIAGLVHSLDSGRGGTVAHIQARVLKGRWHFRRAPPRRTG